MKEEIKRAKFVASSPLRYARRKLGSTSPFCPGKTNATATATLPQLSKMSSACSDCSSSNEQVSCSQSGATAISSRLEQLAAPRSSSSWRGTIQSKRISCREVPLSGSGGINTNVSENVNKETCDDRSVNRLDKSQPKHHRDNKPQNKAILPVSIDKPGQDERYQQCLNDSVDTSLFDRVLTRVNNEPPIKTDNNSWEASLSEFVSRLSGEIDSKLVEIDDVKKRHDADVLHIHKKVERWSPKSTPTTAVYSMNDYTSDSLEWKELHSKVKTLQNEFNDFRLEALHSIKLVNRHLSKETRALTNYVHGEIDTIRSDKIEADFDTLQWKLEESLLEIVRLKEELANAQEGKLKISDCNQNDDFRTSCSTHGFEKECLPIAQSTPMEYQSWFHIFRR